MLLSTFEKRTLQKEDLGDSQSESLMTPFLNLLLHILDEVEKSCLTSECFRSLFRLSLRLEVVQKFIRSAKQSANQTLSR